MHTAGKGIAGQEQRRVQVRELEAAKAGRETGEKTHRQPGLHVAADHQAQPLRPGRGRQIEGGEEKQVRPATAFPRAKLAKPCAVLGCDAGRPPSTLGLMPTNDEDPLVRFHAWLGDARARGLPEPTAMALATADADGIPSVRMVLLKQADADGFVFYTNLDSPKAAALRVRPRAELCFYWNPPGRQVRVNGEVGPVDDAEADAYFATRPYLSRIGAWASSQSHPMRDAFELTRRLTRFTARWPLGKVPRPPHWGGFRLRPGSFEFWEEKPFRLHERVRLTRRPDGGWDRTRIFP